MSQEGRTLRELDAQVAAWLVSRTGRDVVAAATAALDVAEDDLSLATRLRSSGFDAARTSAAMAAAIARRRARDRWPDADRLLFTREGLEQASDPHVSAWRARRYLDADAIVDLCAGLGGDTLALAGGGQRVTAVDRDPGRLTLLRHNAGVRGVDVRPVPGDALVQRRPAGAWVHVDPSRRDGGRRLRALREHHPAVPALVAVHGGAPALGVVLSPAVDLTDPDLPDGELEFIALDGRVTEAMVWSGALRHAGVRASATLLPSGDHRSRSGPAPDLPIGGVGAHLLEVTPAAVRARLHTTIGAELGARRIAARRALLTVDERPPPSAWYRVRTVEAVLSTRAKVLRGWLRTATDQPLEIATHGLSVDPHALWRALGRPPRGPQGRRLDLVRTDAGAITVVSS